MTTQITITEATPKTLLDWEQQLPQAPTPLGAYRPCKQTGTLLYTSGTLPTQNGTLAYKGTVGQDLTIEQAQEAAKLCILNALSNIKQHTGSLKQVKSIIKLVGFVMSDAQFYNQPTVINAASELLTTIFGQDAGCHARSAVGVSNLPLQAPVEIELIVELHEQQP
jgi:enamine deaminase RidA (YjgF/YER057c/UK114 family)